MKPVHVTVALLATSIAANTEWEREPLLEKYFNPSDCDGERLCRIPVTCDPVFCEDSYGLEVKVRGKWGDAERVECYSGKFTEVTLSFFHDEYRDAYDYSRNPQYVEGIRCARMKCSLCGNPSQTHFRGSKFMKSRSWDQCSQFRCGPNSRMANIEGKIDVGETMTCKNVDTNSKDAIWTGSYGDIRTKGNVTCEVLCTLETPLTNICDSAEDNCETINLSDDHSHYCASGTMVYKSSDNQLELTGNNLECDKTRGRWRMDGVEGAKVDIGRAGNVFCRPILCTVKSPLTSICDPDDYLCETISINDESNHCEWSTLVYKSSTDDKELTFSTLECDKYRGIWMISTLEMKFRDEEIENDVDDEEDEIKEFLYDASDIVKGGNVVCRYKDCDISQLCTECMKDTNSTNSYGCPSNHIPVVTNSSTLEPQSLPDSSRFVCKLGKWESETGVPISDSTVVNCTAPSPSATTGIISGTLSYVAVSVVLMLHFIV